MPRIVLNAARNLAVLLALAASWQGGVSVHEPSLTETRVRGLDHAGPARIGAQADLSRGARWGNAEASRALASDSHLAAEAGGFNLLSRASPFGIQPYNQLTTALRGTGLQAHHLIEQRFATLLGQNARQALSMAVTPTEHQAFTNAWRALIPYGEAGTGAATPESVMSAARQIYSNYPEIIQALGL